MNGLITGSKLTESDAACPCPLCESTSTGLLYKGGKASGYRDFMHCTNCDLVFVPKGFFLDGSAERERYLQHNNEVDDPDYRAFLARLYDELKPQLNAGAKGLDYGSGPGPALVAMMREDGFDVREYDPYFCPDKSPLNDTYVFVTCTETAEHFHEPKANFDLLHSILRPGGWLGLMTSMLHNWDEFPDWYYHRDPTHVCFYSPKTMRWVADQYGYDVVFPRQNVVLFRKKNESKP